MACPCILKCLGLEEKDESKNNDVLIVDVEEVLANAAWEAFLVSKSWWKKRTIKKKDYVIEVPMNYYHFEEIARDFRIRKSNPLRPYEQGSSNGQKNGQKRAQASVGPSLVGLKTMFNNNTEKEQKYNFNFEKTRHASVNITYQKGYSIGGRANFTLGLPKLAEDGSLGAEVEAYIQVTKATGETFEETVTTSATSEITVGAGKHYTATVVMEERTLLADFKISIMMTMPAKRAPVYVKDRRSGEVILVRIVGSLPFYFKKFQGVEVPLDAATGKPRKDAVIFHIEGIVDGVQLSSHRINLQQDSATADGAPEMALQSVPDDFLMDKLQDPVTKCVQESVVEGKANGLTLNSADRGQGSVPVGFEGLYADMPTGKIASECSQARNINGNEKERNSAWTDGSVRAETGLKNETRSFVNVGGPPAIIDSRQDTVKTTPKFVDTLPAVETTAEPQ